MLQATRNILHRHVFSKPAVARTAATLAFHKDYNAACEEQTFELSDGRTIGFAEYGDLQGIPAILLHGSPGCRYDPVMLKMLDDAKQLKMRIICPDRPGYGLSSIKSDQKLGDYPDDIGQLARHLELSRYHVFGISGGGPYAIACAYRLPKDELLSASVIAGMGAPAVLTVKDDGWYTVTVLFIAKWMPGILQGIVKWVVADDKRIENSLKKSFNLLVTSEEDRKDLLSPESLKEGVAHMKAFYAQGADGAIRDGQLYAGPWDFQLEDVQNRVKLFYGLKDDNAPPVFGRHYKAHLPNAELIEIEGMSHFNTDKFNHIILDNILRTNDEGPSAKTTSS